MAKEWKDMNYGERLSSLHTMRAEVQIRIREEEEKARTKRAQILNLDTEEKTALRRYNFKLPFEISLKEEDEEKVKRVLEQIGRQRYTDKTEPFYISDTDHEIRQFEGGWRWLELRWPRHYVGYIDSVSIARDEHISGTHEPANVQIWFVRGKREISSSIKRKSLDEQAQQIYEEIEKGVRRIIIQRDSSKKSNLPEYLLN